jgi:hypothetical protein
VNHAVVLYLEQHSAMGMKADGKFWAQRPYRTTQFYLQELPRGPVLTFPNKLFITELLVQPPQRRATPCRVSKTVYSIYLQLPPISGGRLLHPQSEDAPCCADRNLHDMEPHRYPYVIMTSQQIPDELWNHFANDTAIELIHMTDNSFVINSTMGLSSLGRLFCT